MAKTKTKSSKARNRDDDIRNYWQKNRPPLAVEDYYWRMWCYRGDKPKEPWLRLDPLATSLSWEDATILTANISLTKPDEDERLYVVEGHRITVFVAREKSGKYRKLWTLRVVSVTESASGETIEIEAADELDWLKRSRDDFQYKKGSGRSSHKRPEGWKAHQIARDVAKRYGIPVGGLVKGTHNIKNLTEKNASPLSIIEKAYQEERKETGFKYVIKMRNGKLYVTRLRRSRDLLIYGAQAIDAQITRRVKENFATELTVRGTVKEDGKENKEKITVRATKKIRERYGYIHNFFTIDDSVDSKDKMRRRAKRELRERQEPEREVTMTVPGYPGLQMGDAVRLALKTTSGFKELMYVTGASHSVAAGQYTTDLTLSFDEYYEDKEGDKIRAKRCKKAREKNRKLPKFCSKDYDPFAPKTGRSKKSKNRDDSKRPLKPRK